MSKKTVNTVELPAVPESAEEVIRFFRQRLDAEKISKEVISETMLVIEALFHNLIEQDLGSNTMLRLSCRNSLGSVTLNIDFEGRMANLYNMEDGMFSPEDQILQAYEDKIAQSYHFGNNTFQISVKRKHLRTLLFCTFGVLCAILVYIPLSFLPTRKDQFIVLRDYVIPIQRLFGNALLMISAPVTFFSLLKNLMNTYILSNRYSQTRRLRGKGMATALISVLIAIGVVFLLLSRYRQPPLYPEETEAASSAFAGFISEFIPSSIFEPFESFSPVPLIFLALIVTAAFSSSGPYFEKLKKAVDIGYTVFSKMLSMVLFAFPFIFFSSTLELLLFGIDGIMLPILDAILMILAGSAVVALFYLIRLKIGGVRLRPFLRKVLKLIPENCRINSAIDAVPYNIRYCVRNFGLNRKSLEMVLPTLAQTMFDGNCYFMMSIALYLSFDMGKDLTWDSLLILILLIVFLSLGAPNQPGGIMVGTMIILKYLGADPANQMYLAVFFEAAFGVFQNLVNVIGDIVTVTIEEQKKKTKEAAGAI